MFAPRCVRILVMSEKNRPSIRTWSTWFVVCWSGDIQVALWISLRVKKLLQTTIPREASKLMHRRPLSLETVCRLSGPITDLNISSFPDNDFHISPRTAVVHLLKLGVECFFLVVGSFLVWTVHVADALVEETALYPQFTHPLVDRLPPDHKILHLASH